MTRTWVLLSQASAHTYAVPRTFSARVVAQPLLLKTSFVIAISTRLPPAAHGQILRMDPSRALLGVAHLGPGCSSIRAPEGNTHSGSGQRRLKPIVRDIPGSEGSTPRVVSRICFRVMLLDEIKGFHESESEQYLCNPTVA